MQYFLQDLLSWIFYSGLIIGGYWLVGVIIRAIVPEPDDEG